MFNEEEEKMKVRYALIGLAGAALLGAPPALAQTYDANVLVDKTYTEEVDVDIDNIWDVKIQKEFDTDKSISYDGTVTISGSINIERATLALIDNKQIMNDTTIIDDSPENVANIQDDVLEAATGNIQVTIAAGNANQQDNSASISTADGLDISSDAESFVIQKSFNDDIDVTTGGTNDSTLVDQVLENASGNIQIALATGNANQQKNAMVLALVASEKALSEATAAALQEHSFADVNTQVMVNTAEMTDSVLKEASGNIQVTLASGVLNGQINALAISAGGTP
jgi:hypothetical protein